MLLAIMTYGRLESFRGFAFMQAQFKEYMTKTERLHVNEEAENRYKKSPASKREKGDQESQERNPASSTLSFRLFIDKAERDKHPAEFEVHTAIAKNLLRFLYGQQPFFQELEQTRPDFLDGLFSALGEVTEGFSDEEKLKKKKEIATLDLKDPELNDVFTLMLRGVEGPEAKETANFLLDSGYYSLLDFITLQKDKLTTRVYLASPQLLMALFGRPDIVSDIKETRQRLYRDVVNEAITTKEAEEELRARFEDLRLPEVPEKMLNFGVSKTRP